MAPEESSGFRFQSIFLDEVRFRDSISRPADVPPLSFRINVTRRVAESPPSAVVTLGLELGDESALGESPRGDEFHVVVTLTGTFDASPGVETSVTVVEFAEINAPALLLPFVREVVANITARSRRGAVLLPPLNLTRMLGKSVDNALPGNDRTR